MYRNSTGNIAGIAPDVRFVDQQQQAYISGPQYGTPTIKEEETQPMTSGEKVRKGSKDNDASIAFSKVFALSRPAPINRNSMYSDRSLSATNVATGSAAANLIVKKRHGGGLPVYQLHPVAIHKETLNRQPEVR